MLILYNLSLHICHHLYLSGERKRFVFSSLLLLGSKARGVGGVEGGYFPVESGLTEDTLVADPLLLLDSLVEVRTEGIVFWSSFMV